MKTEMEMELTERMACPGRDGSGGGGQGQGALGVWRIGLGSGGVGG